MKRFSLLSLPVFIFLITTCVGPDCKDHYYVDGINEEIEIIIDYTGIPHIYAKNQEDLFYAQGFNAARERLFQFEIWRRQATGTVAEILGEKELKRDIGARLFQFRGDMDTEMSHYHEDGQEIINAFVNGVNAYIKQVKNDPERLPIEFKVLGIEPEYWTPEVVVSRHQGLLGNINQELNIARAVDKGGVEMVKSLSNFKPSNPDLEINPKINSSLLHNDILELYNAFRRPVRFYEQDLDPSFEMAEIDPMLIDPESIGSNNWVINGQISDSGFPVMANDPHRTLSTPSLRYIAHLVAPGWDVIGGGEPEIPGISIGHNGFGAWGLTVFRTDGEDLYVYQINPENPNQYYHKGEWVDMTVISEEITVKDSEKVIVDLKYTVHGPVVYEDLENDVAYAVKCAWLEPGGSPYLASLRIDQAKSWDEFRDACNYFHIPGENMIWADREGNIGWQAVGIAPVRENWSGLVPVPGDGEYEWKEYLEIKKKPHSQNPEEGYIITANNYLVDDSYEYKDGIGFSWADDFRSDRIESWIGSRIDNDTVMPFIENRYLQVSYTSMVSNQLLPFLDNIRVDGSADSLRRKLTYFDYIDLAEYSSEAGLYVAWEREIHDSLRNLSVPDNLKPYFNSLSMEKIISWLKNPQSNLFGNDPVSGRNNFIKSTLENAINKMVERYGPNPEEWKFWSEEYKHVEIKHSLDPLLSDSLKKVFNLPIKPRGGNNYTVNNTGRGDLQNRGASFRIIVDTGDFNKTVFSNSPGQSGNPYDPHYGDLYDGWSKDFFWPLHYNRDSVVKSSDYYVRIFKKDSEE